MSPARRPPDPAASHPDGGRCPSYDGHPRRRAFGQRPARPLPLSLVAPRRWKTRMAGHKIGGTSAWSGGQIWIPNHPHMAKGRTDSREEALTYLSALSHGMIDPAMAETFVDTGADMIRFLEARTPVHFYSIPDFPDYHSEFPGAKRTGGRTLECPPFPYQELGD